MLLKRALVVLIIVVTCVATALAGGYQIGEHGARGMAMGGAFVAQAADGSAIYYNPAGLSFQKGVNVLLGTTLIMPSTTFTGPTPSTASTDMVSQTFTPINVYATYTMDNGLSFGVGVFNPYGLGTEWPSTWVGRHLAVKSDIQTFYINPTVSYKFSDQFSVGVGVSYVIGTVTLDRKLPLTPLPDGGFKLDGDGTGINFNAGILWKPTDVLSIGLSYRSETKIDFEGDATFTNIPNIDPDGPGPSPPLTALFPSGTTGKATLPMPSNLMAGIAYDINKDFTVEADFQYLGWSSYDKLQVTFNKAVYGSTTMADIVDWENSILLRLGGEYRIDKLALRAGFIYDATPQPDKAVDPTLPDANRIEVTVGAGYQLTGMISIEVAYQYVKASDRTVTAPTNSFPGTYKTTANLFGVNLGLKF
jgi:long-chain fatty acid transport protein